jgi:hypothetical protein
VGEGAYKLMSMPRLTALLNQCCILSSIEGVTYYVNLVVLQEVLVIFRLLSGLAGGKKLKFTKPFLLFNIFNNLFSAYPELTLC